MGPTLDAPTNVNTIARSTVERALVIVGALAALVSIAFKWSVAADLCGGTDTALMFGQLLDSTAWSYGFLAGVGVAFGAAFVHGRVSLGLELAAIVLAALSTFILWGSSTVPFEGAGTGGAVGISCAMYPAPGLWLAAASVCLLAAGSAVRIVRERRAR